MKSFRIQIRFSFILLVTVILLTSDVVIYAGLQSLLKSQYTAVELSRRLQSDGSISLDERTLKSLMWLMAMSTGAMIIVSWLASDWFAGKMLTTIQGLSRKAKRLSGVPLDDRGKLETP